jgi:hypothetical protein
MFIYCSTLSAKKFAELGLNNDFYTFTETYIHSLESHRQAFNHKSLTAKLADKINTLIENNGKI